jgi:hypothetical protein
MSKKGPGGAPVGNGNALKHGYHSLVTTLNKGSVDRRTMLGRWQMEKEKELATALGGDPSPQQQIIITDTVKVLLYLASIDAYLLRLKSAVRRGKLHPVMSDRGKLATHLRENLKTLGLSRRIKAVSINDLLAANEKEVEPDYNGNGQTHG